MKFRWPWSRAVVAAPEVPQAAPIEASTVAIVSQPVILSTTVGQQISGAKYRIDAIKRYIEQTAVISDQKMMEFEEECYALRKRIRDLCGEQVDLSFLKRGA